MNYGPFFSDNVQHLTSRHSKKRRKAEAKNELLDRSTSTWRWRTTAIACMGALLLISLSGRLWQLQIIQGEQGREASRNNSLALKTIPAPRGIIYDRNGQILARNEPAFRVAVTYAALPPGPEQQEQVMGKIAELLGMGREEILEKFSQAAEEPFLPITLKKNIDRDTQITLLSAKEQLTGVSVEQDLRRSYPFGESLSHVLGYTGTLSQQDKDNNNASNYYPGEDIGKSGIEQYYESYLRGVIGKQFSQVNSSGQSFFSQNEVAPQPGHSLKLSLDIKLQEFVYRSLINAMEKHKTKGGAAIIQDPHTGQVLSLISAPAYDSNVFAKGISSSQYQKLINDPLKPLYNRAIAGTYPPGSTVKPLVAGAAVQEGIIQPNTIVHSPNQISVGGSTFADWTYWRGQAGPGNINAVTAIAQSTDTFFYKIGGGYEQQKGMGVDMLFRYYTLSGLGSKTGIDIPGEAKGVVPNPDWKAEQFPDDPGWYVGNTYQLAIGQSYLLTTPLQINAMTSAIANNGTLVKPQIVELITSASGETVKKFDTQTVVENIIQGQGLKVAKDGMREGVTNGIVYPLRNNPFQVAAKTGTAEFGNREIPSQYGTHSWITGYAPYDNPQISFTILLDSGGSSTNAAEVANEILEWYFKQLHGEPGNQN